MSERDDLRNWRHGELIGEIERLRQENDKLSEVRGTDQNRFVLELEKAEMVIEAARESH